MLWKRRTNDHISFSEIDAATRLFYVQDTERFTKLICAADLAVWETVKDVEEKKAKLNKKADNGPET